MAGLLFASILLVLSSVKTDEVLPESTESDNGPEVSYVTVGTSLGNVTGTVHDGHSRFFGIPYGEPPVGPNRFQPPIPVKGYDNLQATEFGNTCVQTNFFGQTAGKVTGDEDCLFLNIFTPEVPNGLVSSVSLKPVLFWIYGGSFTQGSSNEYTVPELLVSQDVVVVTINYRLGVFGFMTFGNDVVSGNQGVRDQILALHWVQDHIHNFGGDKSRVTIFGESAGGISVHALLLSPLAEGLFSAAIPQSGNMFMLKTISSISQEWRTAQAQAELFNCSSLDFDNSMLKCLQAISVDELQEKTMIIDFTPDESNNKLDWAIPWPVQDYWSSNPVMPVEPLEAMMRGKFNKVPVMTGTLEHEGALSLVYIQTAEDKENFWRVNGPFFLQMVQSSNKSELTPYERTMVDAIHQFYTNSSNDPIADQDAWERMFQDTTFLSPDQKFVELASHEVAVYNYKYTHRSNLTLTTTYGLPDNHFAPTHADELLLMFNSTFQEEGSEKTAEDDKMADILVKYWTNFAKFANPNGPPQQATQQDETEGGDDASGEENKIESLPEWKPYSNQKAYMELTTSPEMKADNEHLRMFFMQKIYWDQRENEIRRKLLLEDISNSILQF